MQNLIPKTLQNEIVNYSKIQINRSGKVTCMLDNSINVAPKYLSYRFGIDLDLNRLVKFKFESKSIDSLKDEDSVIVFFYQTRLIKNGFGFDRIRIKVRFGQLQTLIHHLLKFRIHKIKDRYSKNLLSENKLLKSSTFLSYLYAEGDINIL